jgi:hypothetical protein
MRGALRAGSPSTPLIPRHPRQRQKDCCRRRSSLGRHRTRRRSRLGSSIAELREQGLIGGARKGCELAPGQRVAPLKAPLEGSAIFYPKDRLSAISLSGGAGTAAGIRVGDSIGAARKAYPKAVYDRPGRVRPFPQGFLWIGGRNRPRMTLLIEPGTHRVGEIDIPNPSFCE